jgi:hypothetical protein
MTNKKYIYGSMVLAMFLVLATAVSAAPAFAEDGWSGGQSDSGVKLGTGLNLGVRTGDNNENGNGQGQDGNRGGMMRGGIFGTVTAVSGNTITVSGKQGAGLNVTSATTFTVDATSATITKNGIREAVSGIAVGDTVMVQGTLTGTNIVATMIRDGIPSMMNRAGRGVSGTVTAVSGNTITITTNKGIGMGGGAAATFTVDATKATITKNGVAGNIASIVVGDKVMIQGTITGTNIVATMIRDGKGKDQQPPISPIAGDGNPIVAGTVSAVSGSTITITNKSNVTYTINATNAKIVKGPNTASVSDIVVGDMVVAQGTINGNAVVATSVIDQSKPVSATNEGRGNVGFFGGIGSFFAHLFGF